MTSRTCFVGKCHFYFWSQYQITEGKTKHWLQTVAWHYLFLIHHQTPVVHDAETAVCVIVPGVILHWSSWLWLLLATATDWSVCLSVYRPKGRQLTCTLMSLMVHSCTVSLSCASIKPCTCCLWRLRLWTGSRFSSALWGIAGRLFFW